MAGARDAVLLGSLVASPEGPSSLGIPCPLAPCCKGLDLFDVQTWLQQLLTSAT